MIKTVDLPAAWGRYAHLYSEGNEFRLGNRAITDPFTTYVNYNSWVKFDTSQLTTLKIKDWQITSASIRVYVTSPATVPDVAIHRVIRDATTSLDYNTYDGTNLWGRSGGRGLGTDIITTPISTPTFSGNENNISISAANLMDIHTSNRPVLFWTPDDWINNNIYLVTSNSNISIRVTYKFSGLAGDATMF